MEFHCKKILTILIFQFLILNCDSKDNFEKNSNEIINTKSILIKVLLEEINCDKTICLSSKDEILITNKRNKKKKIGNNITISFLKNNILLNNQEFDNSYLKFETQNELITFDNKQYQGIFIIINTNNNYFLINELELEDYIFSVLKTESWPGWPLEINKVLAIAARSYVISKFLEAKKKKNLYHIKNTNKHQTYQGFHNSKILKNAVEETKGIILGFNKIPILAMFDICCGGVIPAKLNKVNFNHAPYLKRKQVCNFCKSYKYYSWNLEYQKDQLEKILIQEFQNLNSLKKIRITKNDRAGIVQQIEIKDKKNKFYLTPKKLNSLLKSLKSSCFSLIQKGEKILIRGFGFGHHLGICQWGAREMVNLGWDYKSILKFYYPGTNFMKLK